MKTVFFDVDTQSDFLYPAGALYIPGAESIIPAVARLNRYAAAHGIPLISTVDAHAEADPEFAVWPPHCVAGTLGQRKPAETILEGSLTLPNAAFEPAAGHAPQILLEKQSVDVFTCRALPGLLEALNADAYVVYGVVTEICVLSAAMGLLRTGKPVTVVMDAIKGLRDDNVQKALDEIQSAGGRLAGIGEITG